MNVEPETTIEGDWYELFKRKKDSFKS
jgi:hypothetical protein